MRKLYYVAYALMALFYAGLFVEVLHTGSGRGDLGWVLLYGATFKPVCKWAAVGLCRMLFGSEESE